jgi:hypothetical protein
VQALGLGPAVRIFTNGDDAAFLAQTSKFAVLSFRGTVNIGGWLTDLEALLTDHPPWVGRVHCGFADAAEVFLTSMLQVLTHDRPLWITGHSRGAAFATLIADELVAMGWKGVMPVYTFGSPRVGDSTFAGKYLPTLYRVVNDLDPVPHVPHHALGKGEFVHAGQQFWLDASAKVCTSVSVWKTLTNLMTLLEHGPQHLALGALEDHMIWNYIAALEREPS